MQQHRNTYVDLDGRTYRVCHVGPERPGRFFGMIGLRSTKGRAGRERMIDPDGKRARQIVAAAERQGRATPDIQPITCGDCERRIDQPGTTCPDAHCPHAGRFAA